MRGRILPMIALLAGVAPWVFQKAIHVLQASGPLPDVWGTLLILLILPVGWCCPILAVACGLVALSKPKNFASGRGARIAALIAALLGIAMGLAWLACMLFSFASRPGRGFYGDL